ncbi:MAG: hypothetical protein IKP01_02220 [Bacteroidales bacterium]|nr:hypothetical protein [Bacteroidales bacterium]
MAKIKALKTKVSNLTAPSRSGAKFTSKFEVPAAAKKSGAKASVKVTGLDMRWDFDAEPATPGLSQGKGDVVTADSSGKNTSKSDTETLNRKLFWPFAGKPKLLSASFWVRGYNVQSGKRVYGPWVYKTLNLAAPDKPKSCSLSYDSSTGNVTPSYVSEHPDGPKEVYSTQVWVTAGTQKLYDGASYTDVSKTLAAKTVTGATSLGVGEKIKVEMSARNRGLRGDSALARSANLYICHPNAPVCGTPTLSYATPGTLATASVRVPITHTGYVKDGGTVIQPDTVKLQRLVNSMTENDATSAASSQGWEDVTSVNGPTNGLTDAYSSCVSDAGKYTWFRAVAVRDGYTVYGAPVRAKCIDVLTSSTVAGAADISALASGDDGKSAVATLTGKQADDEGYEVSWSTEPDAWESTEQPETFHTTGSTLIVRGLEEGTRYFMRARAYDLDSDGNYIYGDYCGNVEVTPYTTPSMVALYCPNTVERGKDIQYTWTYDTDAPQAEWRLVNSSGVVEHSGTGTACAYTLPADAYGSASSVTYYVEVTTGGGWAKSAARTVHIADAPTCALTLASTLTAQPLSFSVASDTGDTVRVSVSALGSSGTGLYGDRVQFAGDTVYSGVVEPSFSGTPRSATVTLPRGLAFFNAAQYRVAVTAVDGAAGLESQPATGDFEVDWSHTASQPTGSVAVDQSAMSATVTVTAPADAEMGDVFDLYRVTMDGERPIARSQPFGTAVTDVKAPYSRDGSNLRYLAVTRTADGDSCVSDDISYTLKGSMLRLDWGGDFVELPYNIKASDEFAKDSEVRKHVDGTSQAYWNEGVTRKASLDTDLVRFRDAEEQELLRGMFQHAGSVFVRTPDGLAFAADVQPGTVERSSDSGTVGVSLKAVEHDLTDEGRPGEADIVQPTWGGESLDNLDGTVYDGDGLFPLYGWSYIGEASSTAYYCAPDGSVYTGSGVLEEDWTWDGEVLEDENGDPVEVS